jgi:putative endonuclease
MESAILREKQLKNWRRAWKLALIEEANPAWSDLAEDYGFESLIGKKVDPIKSGVTRVGDAGDDWGCR